MRSRSTTPSSSDVSTVYAVLSPPTDPVDPITAAMEQVNLENSAVSSSEDDSFEIVVMPVSPASEQSEDSLFSVLSIPSSVASGHEPEPGSDSESDDSLSGSASDRSPQSVPVSSFDRPAHADVRPTEAKECSHPRASATCVVPATFSVDAASSTSRTSQPQHTGFSQAISMPAPLGSTVATADPLAGLTKDQRKRRRKAAAKAAARLILDGSLSKQDATVGFSAAQNKRVERLIREATGAAQGHPSKVKRLSKGQKQRRRKADAKTAARQVLSGSRTKEEAIVGFTKSQRKLFNLTIREAKKAEEADVQRAVTAVLAGEPALSKVTEGFTGAQMLRFNQGLRAATNDTIPSLSVGVGLNKIQRKKLNRARRAAEAQGSGGDIAEGEGPSATDAVSTSSDHATSISQPQKQLASAQEQPVDLDIQEPIRIQPIYVASKAPKQQGKISRKAAVKAAVKAVLAGKKAPEDATKGFTEAQKLRFNNALIEAPKPENPSYVSRGPATKMTSYNRKRLNRFCHRAFDVDSDSDEDEGGDDSGSESGYSTDTASTMSSQDAAKAIYDFFSDTESFTSHQENKLRLWQALCIEFGLVEAEDLADLPTQRTHRSSAPSPPSPSSSSNDSDESPAPSRSVTPTQANPFPTSLNQAKNLLGTAHVNLSEYMTLRKENSNPQPGEYAYLLEPSAKDLRKLLRRSHQFAKLSDVKAEWLNPLLKDFGFARSRGRSA